MAFMTVLLIGFGGFLGTIARYGVYFLFKPTLESFPWGTFIVNTLGCFLIGCIFFWGQKQTVVPSVLFPVISTGFLGGFTTFSTFGFESFMLIQNQQYAFAAANILGSAVFGLGAIALAHTIFF